LNGVRGRFGRVQFRGGTRGELWRSDATLSIESLRRLIAVLSENPAIGAVAPRVVHVGGAIAHSLRRFPRVRSTFAQALFLHRIFPDALWTDEVIRNEAFYDEFRPAEWVSGACVLVRREALSEVGNLDETFFLYSEDTDLCKRLWTHGHGVWFVPSVTAVHEGGASAPRTTLLPVLTESRRRYARKHHGRAVAAMHTTGIVLGALTHVVFCRGGASGRRGWIRALAAAVRPIAY
jgi:GT2 family glycosyltransferase